MSQASSNMCEDGVVGLYERHAQVYDQERDRSLQERAWLDQFMACVYPGGTVLDVGCGMGEPIARYLIEHKFRVVGVDASPSMIQLCRTRFPQSEWHVTDMRELDLGRRFDGVLAWDSFFHLGKDDQRGMFRRFASHARPGAPLLFTSGPAEGEVVGSWCAEPLYHASLGPAEYRDLLAANGLWQARTLRGIPHAGSTRSGWQRTTRRSGSDMSLQPTAAADRDPAARGSRRLPRASDSSQPLQGDDHET